MKKRELKLTARQNQVVKTKKRHVAVIAGPGTGKTRVITERVKHLAQQEGIEPHRILVVVYGRQAAQVIKERLVKAMVSGVKVSTLHAFAYNQLFGDRDESEITSDKPAEAKKLLGRLKDEVAEHTIPMKDLIQILSYASNSGKSVSSTIDDRYEHWSYLKVQIETLERKYTSEKVRLDFWDFNDLIIDATAHLRSLSARGQYLDLIHIIVDEYQDVNVAQRQMIAALMNAIRPKNRNLFVVGDPAQTINSYTGVDTDGFSQFMTNWPNAQQYKLTLNHRSTEQILRLASAIEKPLKLGRTLKSSRHKAGFKPILREFGTRKNEAEGIALKIKSLIKEGHRARDIAVLARTHYDLQLIHKEAEKLSIPVLTSSDDKWLDGEHVLDVLAVFALYDNCQDSDALFRCLRLYQGITQVSAEHLVKNFIGAQSASILIKLIAEHAPKGFKKFWTLQECLKIVGDDSVALDERIGQVVQRLKPLITKKYGRGWSTMLVDFKRLGVLAEENRSYAELKTACEVVNSNVVDELCNAEDAVAMLTFHASKGSEWKIGFLAGLNDGSIPSNRAYGREQLLEERRIFFVGVTRVKQRLYMTRYRVDFGRKMSLSRFIRDKAVMTAIKRLPYRNKKLVN